MSDKCIILHVWIYSSYICIFESYEMIEDIWKCNETSNISDLLISELKFIIINNYYKSKLSLNEIFILFLSKIKCIIIIQDEEFIKQIITIFRIYLFVISVRRCVRSKY